MLGLLCISRSSVVLDIISGQWILLPVHGVGGRGTTLKLNYFCPRMSINERCDAEKITSLVQHHVPKGKLSQQHEAELTFTLPFESMDTFSGQMSVSVLCHTAGRLLRLLWRRLQLSSPCLL